MTTPLRYADREAAVTTARELAAKYGRSFEVREITDKTVWDHYRAKFVPRSYGWAKWEVIGPHGLFFRAPFDYRDPDLPNEEEDRLEPQGPSGLQPPEEWTHLDGWNEYGPDADAKD